MRGKFGTMREKYDLGGVPQSPDPGTDARLGASCAQVAVTHAQQAKDVAVDSYADHYFQRYQSETSARRCVPATPLYPVDRSSSSEDLRALPLLAGLLFSWDP